MLNNQITSGTFILLLLQLVQKACNFWTENKFQIHVSLSCQTDS